MARAQLAANALTTLAEVKDVLGIKGTDFDNRLARQLNAASNAIETYLGRALGYGTHVERLQGTNTQRLFLAVTPLESVTSIVFNGEAIPSTEYEIEDGARGWLWRPNAAWSQQNYRVPFSVTDQRIPDTGEFSYVVTYVGGYVLPTCDEGTPTLPADIEEAAIGTVAAQFRRSGRDQDVIAERMGKSSVQFGGVNTAIGRGAGGIIPDQFLPTLDAYKRRHV